MRSRVAKGKKNTLTRHGVPATLLIPLAEAKTIPSHREIVEGIRALRRRVKPGRMTVREMIEQGRRL